MTYQLHQVYFQFSLIRNHFTKSESNLRKRIEDPTHKIPAKKVTYYNFAAALEMEVTATADWCPCYRCWRRLCYQNTYLAGGWWWWLWRYSNPRCVDACVCVGGFRQRWRLVVIVMYGKFQWRVVGNYVGVGNCGCFSGLDYRDSGGPKTPKYREKPGKIMKISS